MTQFSIPQVPPDTGNSGVGGSSAVGAQRVGFSARQLGVPPGCFLPLVTKEKIWKGEFVDLGTLLVVEEQKKDVPMSFFFQVGGQI